MNADKNSYKKSSFGPAFLFLCKRRREALAVYYVFCRLMDDIADEPDVTDRLAELALWKEEISRAFSGKAQTPLGKDIARMAPQYGMTEDRFLLLIEGMEADVRGRVYKNFEELQWYLWRVAGIVGLATLDILGVKGPQAQELARAQGFAVQLTNIVRDVHEDAALGRVYLPEDLLAKCAGNPAYEQAPAYGDLQDALDTYAEEKIDMADDGELVSAAEALSDAMKVLQDVVTGVSDVLYDGVPVSADYFTLDGKPAQAITKGVIIVKERDAAGNVRTWKKIN